MRPPPASGWEALRGAGLLARDDAFWRHQPGDSPADSPAVARALNSLARRPNNRPVSYCKHVGSQMSVFSIAALTSGESGVTAGSKRATTLPSRSTRNLVLFL